MSDGYRVRRTQYRDVSGSLLVGPTVAPVVLVACKSANYTLFLQELKVHVASPGFDGSYWSFRDSTPGVPISGQIPTDHSPVAPGFPYSFDQDFGPEGIALTPGADFVFDPIASDAHGTITWTGYMKLTSTVNLSSNLE
jgi:hypothetical protein